MGEVIEHASQLEVFPNMGRRLRSIGSPAGEEQNVRRLLFKDVWIVYEVREVDPESDDEHPERTGNGPHILVLTVRHVREKPDED